MSIIRQVLGRVKEQKVVTQATTQRPVVKDYLNVGLTKHAVSDQPGYMIGQKGFTAASQSPM